MNITSALAGRNIVNKATHNNGYKELLDLAYF